MIPTEEQEAAITTHERHCVVRAGAGSGKTAVIAQRVMELIHRGVIPRGIVVLTFSRAAAAEMRERLGAYASQVHVGTFHSVILEVMSALGESPAVLSDIEAKRTLEEACLAAGVAVKKKGKVSYKSSSAAKWRKSVDMREKSNVATIYLSKLSMRGDIDYMSIIHRGIDLAINGLFTPTHVIVDEAQDNDPLQWRLIELLAQKSEVMIVGDVNQTIHAWRGATPEQLDIDWPNYPITETFRVPQTPVKLINRIKMVNMKLRSNIEGGSVHLCDEQSDTLSLLDRALQKFDPDDIAFLCRYNDQADMLADAIRGHMHATGREQIEVGRNKKVERGAAYWIFRYFASPWSETARQQAQLALDGIHYSGTHIGQLIQSGRPTRQIADEVDMWVRSLGPYCSIADIASAMSLWTDDLNMLVTAYKNETLDYFRREECSELHKAASSGITVGTVHGAKGLEWPCVFVMMDGKRVNLEECRLFYVGATRTKDTLILAHGCRNYLME